jgi:hypothetical protein
VCAAGRARRRAPFLHRGRRGLRVALRG